jgi:hypothetical protein
VSRGLKFFVFGEPLMSFPPTVVNRVYQSTRKSETSPDFAIIELPATPPVLSFCAAVRYWPHVFGTARPASLRRSSR